MTINKTAIAIALACINTQIIAEESEKIYDTITVTASRVATASSKTTNTVTVIDAERLENELARNIKDIVRYEPGVSVTGGRRFGLSGFKIRGIGGDRVLTLVDGVPVADEFSFGPNLSAGRNFIDIDNLKAVEIVRGSSSSLYGSNALGGTVSFVTKDPNDYLGIYGPNHYASLKAGYNSNDASKHYSGTIVFGEQKWQGMLLATHRDFNELESYFTDDSTGAHRKAADPQEGNSDNIFGKVVYSPSDQHQFKVIFSQYQYEQNTDALSLKGEPSSGATRLGVLGFDEQNRDRISFQYEYRDNSLFADDINLNIYHQSSETSQHVEELREIGMLTYRFRDSYFEQDNTGIKLQLNKSFGTNINHLLAYGIDWDTMETETLRAGFTKDTAGNDIPEYSNFPTRDFPNSEYQSLGIFVQDRINFDQGNFLLVPSVRYDRFELTPTADAVYLAGNTGSPTPEAYDESEVSAKLGGLYKITDDWSFFAQYSEGFKAPPIDAINTGFTNFRGGYTAIPNPDLRPETSEGFEYGLKYYGSGAFFEITGYETDYNDFIESLAMKGFNPTTGLLEFQAKNLPKVKIKGFEFKGGYNIKSVEGLNLNYAYAQATGEDIETGQPISTIDPRELVMGLSYDSIEDNWGGQVAFTVIESHEEGELPDAAPDTFYAPSYSLIDLMGYYRFSDNFRLNFGLYNLTDRKYWSSDSVITLKTNSSNLDRLTQPGRNLALNIKYEF